MSIFLVYKGPIGDLHAEFRGMGLAGKRFADVFKPGQPDNVFEELIFSLIKKDKCRVTYAPKPNQVHQVKAVKHKGKIVIYYKDAAGNDIPLRVKAIQDDPNDNLVAMAVPSRRVQISDEYLTDAVRTLADTSLDERERQAYLLGMLLLRRCR